MDLTSFQLVSFDCFGTLIDWEAGILGALRPVLASRGVEAGDDELLALYAELEHRSEDGARQEFRSYREVLGEVMEGVASHFGFHAAAREHDALADSMEHWQPFADTREALRVLKRRYKLGVLSNVDNDLFGPAKARLGVDLDYVVTAELCRSYKPGEKHWRVLRALCGLPKEKILHVAESRFHDIAPAKAMGYATVWVNRRGGAGRHGGGASEGAWDAHTYEATPDLEVPDLATFVRLCEAEWKIKRW